MTGVTCVHEARAIVGESPRWNPRDGGLYWVDIYAPALHRFEPETGRTERWPLPERVGCFSFCPDGRLIAGMQNGIGFIEPDTQDVERVFDFEPDNPDSRFNDGRCDPGGRFWAGTMVERLDRNVGVLYRYDPDRTIHRMVDGLVCPNGLAFAPDGRALYHSDSRQDFVWAWDLDPATGDISGRRVFLANDIMEGRPDGAAVDAEGGYWISCVGGWRVARFLPDGVIDRVIGVPVQRPTACTFGGTDLDTLYITSATFPLSETALRKQPLAGGLFAVRPGVRGLPEAEFGG